ncbi:MAG: SDR family oxidoreductase [Deltaproteobacteria bacterium]|nr:SDR family oxidoreductase [Deltaproteobacteria bacterium]
MRRVTDQPPGARHVFITGFPGFIARRLVRQLLVDEPDSHVTALVEERQMVKARRCREDLDAAGARRLQLITGDVMSMDLGLSGEEFATLRDRVSTVFHLAAIHALKADEDEAERINVGGTRAVLEFARECRQLDRVVHFSSCYVAGDRIGVIREEELSMGQRFRNPYEATKYRAELLVRAAMTDLPVTVLRPSIVVGDSATGEMDRFDGIYQVGVLVVASPLYVPLPLPGDGVAPLNMVPVDFVVNASLALSRDPRAVGRTFHVVDPNPLSSRAVYDLMAQKAGRRPRTLRISPGLTRLVTRIPWLDQLVPQGIQALHYLNQLAIYSSPNTLELLHGTGIMCPRFESYADKLMQYLRARLKTAARVESEDPLDPAHAHAPPA